MLNTEVAERLAKHLVAHQDRKAYRKVAQELVAAGCSADDLRRHAKGYKDVITWQLLEQEVQYAKDPEAQLRGVPPQISRTDEEGTHRDRLGTDLTTGRRTSVPSRSSSSCRSSSVPIEEFLQAAVARMSTEDLPAGAEKYRPWEQQLLALCRACQELQTGGRDDFFLPVRKAVEHIGLDPGRYKGRAHYLMTVAFVRDEFLVVTARGQPFKGGRANRYRLGPAWRVEAVEPR